MSIATRVRVQRLLIAWLAVSGLILSTACSKKDDSPSAPAAPPAPPAPSASRVGPSPTPSPSATPSSSAPSVPSSTSSSQHVNQMPPPPTLPPGVGGHRIGGHPELDHGSSTSSQDPQVDRNAPPGEVSNSAPSTDSKASGGAGEQVKVADNEIVMDPTGLTPDQIFEASEKEKQPATGAASNVSGLLYSGSGQDYLREQIANIVSAEPDASSDESVAFAKRLGLTAVDVDWKTRHAKIGIQLPAEGGGHQSYEFSGQLDNKLRVTAGDFSRAPYVVVDAVCMDFNGGCATVHVRIKKQTRSKMLIAHVIARQTSAYLYISGNPVGVSQNREYDNLMNLLLNTVYSPGSADSVEGLRFFTSETINGSSRFAVIMQLGIADPYHPKTGQMLAFEGPLVKPADSADLDLMVANPSRGSSAKVAGRQTNLSASIADTIRETHLVKNDGHGNIELDITVRKANAVASEDTIRLTIARVHQPVRSPVLH